MTQYIGEAASGVKSNGGWWLWRLSPGVEETAAASAYQNAGGIAKRRKLHLKIAKKLNYRGLPAGCAKETAPIHHRQRISKKNNKQSGVIGGDILSLLPALAPCAAQEGKRLRSKSAGKCNRLSRTLQGETRRRRKYQISLR